MTSEQKHHVATLVDEFTEEFSEKYAAGQAEHGGNIWEKPKVLESALEEVHDQYCYVKVLIKRRNLALGILKAALHAPMSDKDELIRKAISLVE